MFHTGHSIEVLGRTVGSLSTKNTQTRLRPGVLYADRSIIALNKPPGLVSQGTSSILEGAVHNISRENSQDVAPSKSAFNVMLDGNFSIYYFLFCRIIGRVISTSAPSGLQSFGGDMA